MRLGCLALLVVVGCQASQPDLSSTEQLIVSVSPTSRDFGTITVGQASAPATITINPGLNNSYDVVSSITESCPNFSVDAPYLPAEVYRECIGGGGEVPLATGSNTNLVQPPICTETIYVNYQFTATFHPTVAGPQSCVVTISLNSGTSSKIVTLSGTGQPPPIDIDTSPGALQFGDVRINTASNEATLAVRNLGSATLVVGSASVSGGYSMMGPSSFQVGPGGQTNLGVTCHPSGLGPLNGQLVLQSNDPATPTVTVPLSCNGVDSNLAIQPSPAVFPITRVGEPVQQTIRLVNTGGASTGVQSVDLAGTGLALVNPISPATLGPGEGIDVLVAFDAAAQGETSATLQVATSEGPRSAQVSARAVLSTMAINPDGAVSFGPVCVGQSSQHPFTVLGNSDGGFAIDTISTPAAPFGVAPPALPAVVLGAGANQVVFSVSAAPTEVGPFTSELVVDTDIPGEPPRTIVLSVEGLPEGVSATPVELDLGGHPLDVTSFGQPLQLTNCTPDPTTFSNPRLEGPDAAEFAIVAQPSSSMIGANQTVEWLVVLSPRSVGPKQATFLVDHPGGTATISLVGEGLGRLAGGGVISYYACSAGSATAAWPVALAFVFVARRRRRGSRS
ncbi:MAG: choice-of-anchor D domain-containing protein [Kofleriaceae bacterium]